MQKSVEEINTVQRRVNVTIEIQTVDEAFEKAFQDIQKKAKLKGFRPGKAPMNHIKKMFADSVAADVADKLIREHLFNAIEESNIRPIASPSIDKIELPKQGTEFSFSAVIDILPQLELGEYRGLHVTCPSMAVNEGMVDKELEILQKSQAKRKAVESDTSAQKGMMAKVSYTASQGDAAQTIPDLSQNDIEFEIGQNQIAITALENAVVGMHAGEEKPVEVSLPKDFYNQDFAEKTVNFNLKLSELNDLVLPALDDELAKDIGFKDLNELRGRVRERLEYHSRTMKRRTIEESLVKNIIEKHPFEVPPAMINAVIDDMIDQVPWRDKRQMDKLKKDKEFRNNFSEQAKQKARGTLVLWEVAKKENLQVSDQDIENHLKSMTQDSGSEEKQQKAIKDLKTKIGQQLRENLLFEKAVDFLISNAKIVET